jgi:uncharacterized protein (TIGR03000 family)
MIARWSTPALLGAVATALLLTPTVASAQVILFPYGGGGGYGSFFGSRPYTFGGQSPWSGPYGYPGMYGGYGYPGMYGGYGYPGMGGYPGLRPGPVGLGSGYPYGGGGQGGQGAANYYSGPLILPGWAAREEEPRKRDTLHPALPIAYSRGVMARDDTAHIQVQLPNGKAVVEFQGVKTSQTGMMRNFVSPPLADGDYTYTIVARWMVDGKQHTEKKSVTVQPGSTVFVDFTK